MQIESFVGKAVPRLFGIVAKLGIIAQMTTLIDC